MIRSINCPGCCVGNFPAEGQRIVCGLALYSMRCDFCGASITIGEPARAVSTFVDETEYQPWEHNFLFGTRHEMLRETK